MCSLFKDAFSNDPIQSVPGGKVSILGGYSIGHSKQKKCICTCVLFRTVSEIEQWVYFVDVVKWRDNHVLIFCTVIYCHYAEYTDELQLDDLPVAG
jgi:hypothetical protein